MGVGSGFYTYDVVVKRLRSLSHLLMSSCYIIPTTDGDRQTGEQSLAIAYTHDRIASRGEKRLSLSYS